MTRFPFSRQLAAIAACALCLCMAFAAPAGADETSDYPADAAARDFTSSAGNWTSTSTFDGSCVAPILCPTITNAFVPAGGADGNGYITAAFTGVVGVDAVAGTSTSVWESPQFVYSGARGQSPTTIALTMNRRANVDQLLAVAGNAADYTVQLSDVSAGGAGQTVIGPATLAGADTWIGPAGLRSNQGSSTPATTTGSGSRPATRPAPASSSAAPPTTTTSFSRRSAPAAATAVERQRRRQRRRAELRAAALAVWLRDVLHGGPQGQPPARQGQVPEDDRPRLPDHGPGPAPQAQAGDRQAHGQGAQRQGQAGRPQGQAEAPRQGR